jgi:hypothetical protein
MQLALNVVVLARSTHVCCWLPGGRARCPQASLVLSSSLRRWVSGRAPGKASGACARGVGQKSMCQRSMCQRSMCQRSIWSRNMRHSCVPGMRRDSLVPGPAFGLAQARRAGETTQPICLAGLASARSRCPCSPAARSARAFRCLGDGIWPVRQRPFPACCANSSAFHLPRLKAEALNEIERQPAKQFVLCVR